MNFIIFNVILLFGSILSVFVFSIGLLACMAPMALFSKSEGPPKSFTIPFLAFASIYQIYFWGFWSAFCVAMTIKFAHKPEVSWDVLYWITGFIWCISSIWWLAHKEKQSSQSLKEIRGIQRGTTLYSFISIAAFLVFSFFPIFILLPYGWALKPIGLLADIHTKNANNVMIADSERGHTIKSENEKALCKTTIMSFVKAHAMMSDDKGRIVQLSAEQQAQMKSLINDGLSAASRVSDEYLRRIHPDLPMEFRNHLVDGWRLYLNGLQSSELRKQKQGIQLLLLWEDFKGKNVDLLYENIIR